ncbi:HlyD family secretion protein [Pontibacter pudoricolor]|uniref:HlyD family secretion protein n=1 Tax=Pontibacter pudoricolor TaxID=2694930 RepID=UPI001390C4BD|nr:HlyD family efflux transporter periplasmic adaptor subunit [Pontibacter pudoricolor]
MPFIQPTGQEHSPEVQEIIGAVPGWLLRWGISLFFGVLLLILVFAGVIKSPDIVPARLRVDAEIRPQEVLARREGKLTRLFVKADQRVRKGDVLGFVESNADHDEVLSLSRLVDALQENMLEGNYAYAGSIRFNTRTHYGEMQPALQEFYLAYLQFLSYTPDGVFNKKEQAIRNEIHSLTLLAAQLAAQEQINQEEYSIAENEYSMHQKLAEANVISRQEFRQQESKFLNSRLPLHNTRSSLISNSISREQKLRELMEMEHETVQQRAAFLAQIQKFKSELDSWKKAYVLVSERDGKVVFHQGLRQNQWLQANRPVMYITDGQQDLQPFGELTLGQQSFGKIRVGQEVLIRLNAYPAQEFGLLRGRITYLSSVLHGDSAYTARVTLPQVTTYNKAIHLQIGLVARAEVVTAEQSLLERVFDNTRDILVNR